MHGELAPPVVGNGADFSRANKVMFIRVACEGLIKFLLARFSQNSQSSSARISPDPLSVYMHLLSGAMPLSTCSGGANVRLAPLHATTEIISFPGIRFWIA